MVVVVEAVVVLAAIARQVGGASSVGAPDEALLQASLEGT